jgi:hypothetical protein
MKKLFVLSILVVAILLAASPVFAQTAKGENVAALKDSVTTKLAGGKTYMTVGSRQICTTADPKHPLNGASGDCDGACVMDAAAAATCMGSCTWVDREGDIAFFTWDGQTEGTWKLAGGSGKWKGSSGQGTWKNTETAAPGNFARNSWEGTMSMAKK